MSDRPIGDYALLSDCRSAALVSSEGSVDWLCFPRFDGPSVFGRILDERAGHWSIKPAGEFSTERQYVSDTMLLETTFRTPSGTARMVDGLAVGRNERGHQLGHGATCALLRMVTGIEGSVELELELTTCRGGRPEGGSSHAEELGVGQRSARLLSAAQVAARWRTLDRCSSRPRSATMGSAHVDSWIGNSADNADFLVREVQLVAGTAWLFAREDMDQQIDWLFIDEAGQIATADALAMGTCARNVVLVGDPRQLPQVTQGTHSAGSGRSARRSTGTSKEARCSALSQAWMRSQASATGSPKKSTPQLTAHPLNSCHRSPARWWSRRTAS